MVFLALLTKELRSRMRRERTIWLMIIYILLLGFAGWLVVQNTTTQYTYGASTNITGSVLYSILSILQLTLIIFITPAFTASAVNSEKERQTFDLLLCSRLSGLELVSGKLIAGMINALLLIASSVPLFSLLLFFGGVSPIQLLIVLWIYIVTALLVGSGSLFCSIILKRPALSTAIAYVINLLWLSSPLIVIFLWYVLTKQSPSSYQYPFLFSWSPFVAVATLPESIASSFALDFGNHFQMPIWVGYTVISLFLTAIFFIVSAELVRPGTHNTLFGRRKKARVSRPTA